MHKRPVVAAGILMLLPLSMLCRAQSAPSSGLPVTISIDDRTRVDTWQWFAAPPKSETYAYVESLLRLSIAQHIRQWDWQLELSQPSVLGLPSDAVSTVTAQGQLGLGGTYYASNANNTEAAAAFLKQGYVRYHFPDEHTNLRLGRFEFIEGQEMKPAN